MNELKKPNQPHSRYLKVGIWLVLSALILTGLAIIVGVAFEEIVGEQVSIEEIVYLPQQHDYSRGTSTLSYSMAARYSNGNIGALPEANEALVEDRPDDPTVNTPINSSDLTRAEKEWTFNNSGSGRSGNIQDWTVAKNGTYTIEAWGAKGGRGMNRSPGDGAKIKGDFELIKDDKINIVVGQMGTDHGYNGGGGGGSFVYKGRNKRIERRNRTSESIGIQTRISRIYTKVKGERRKKKYIMLILLILSK